MTPPICDQNKLLEIVRDVYQHLPFNRLLGLKASYLEIDEAGFDFEMQNCLVGNVSSGILHGGVISAVLDATGGMTATASIVQRLKGCSADEIRQSIYRIGTIDMRVDYLRPGSGTAFYSRGTVMRAGRTVAVTRMELKNQEHTLIAVGTGAYYVG
jgi:uncharacterized protein (TIGR00369 family)